MPEPTFGLPAKRNPHTNQNKLERAAKAQEKYWASFQHNPMVRCVVCKRRRRQSVMVYYVSDDCFACPECQERLKDESSDCM